MGRYYYPNAIDALDAKKQFLREHHYRIGHCFKNTWGKGYVLFDTKAEVNAWYKEHTGSYFYTEEYEPGTLFTKTDAIKEIESSYGCTIDNALRNRDYSMPILAIGLPSSSAFGNSLLLKFSRSTDENDIEWRFYVHYNARILNVSSYMTNSELRNKIVNLLYEYFYDNRFKKRIEGSKAYNSTESSPSVHSQTSTTSTSNTYSSQSSNIYQRSYSSQDKSVNEFGCALAGFFGAMGGVILGASTQNTFLGFIGLVAGSAFGFWFPNRND